MSNLLNTSTISPPPSLNYDPSRADIRALVDSVEKARVSLINAINSNTQLSSISPDTPLVNIAPSIKVDRSEYLSKPLYNDLAYSVIKDGWGNHLLPTGGKTLSYTVPDNISKACAIINCKGDKYDPQISCVILDSDNNLIKLFMSSAPPRLESQSIEYLESGWTVSGHVPQTTLDEESILLSILVYPTD